MQAGYIQYACVVCVFRSDSIPYEFPHVYVFRPMHKKITAANQKYLFPSIVYVYAAEPYGNAAEI